MARKIPSPGRSRCSRRPARFGELLKQGWKPKRTIIYCAWDGEEPMLLGSTEWAEYHGEELKQHAAIYINTDGNGRGFLQAEGSHSLEKFVNSVARDITDPEKNISVWKRRPGPAADRRAARRSKEARSALTCVSARWAPAATTPRFIDHLGVASLNLGFRRRG